MQKCYNQFYFYSTKKTFRIDVTLMFFFQIEKCMDENQHCANQELSNVMFRKYIRHMMRIDGAM